MTTTIYEWREYIYKSISSFMKPVIELPTLILNECIVFLKEALIILIEE
jgi:hypothetical protein